MTPESAKGTAAERPPGEAGRETMSRRRFFGWALGVTGILAVGGAFGPGLRYLFPSLNAKAAPKVEVAKREDLEPLGEAVTFDYMGSPAALILMEDGTPKAYSMVCTHLACIVTWRVSEKDFYCPCHQAVFAADGTVVSGPPPRPLDELAVLEEDGLLFVKGRAT